MLLELVKSLISAQRALAPNYKLLSTIHTVKLEAAEKANDIAEFVVKKSGVAKERILRSTASKGLLVLLKILKILKIEPLHESKIQYGSSHDCS